MFALEMNEGILTITYRNYAWVKEKTLGMKNSAELSAMLSMCGISIGRSITCIPQGSKAGYLCRMYL
jgi:hypothetical protein